MDADVGPDGRVVFGGMIDAFADLPYTPDLSAGAYAAPRVGPLATIARPGDVLGGATIRHAANPTTNRAGDVGFTALDTPGSDFCLAVFEPWCGTAAYVRRAGNAVPARDRARRAPAAPVAAALAPATYTPFAFQGPVVVEGDSAAFQACVEIRRSGLHVGDLPARGWRHAAGRLELRRPLPKGGTLAFHGDYDVNRAGTVVFEAALDSDDNADGLLDSGIYAASAAGGLSLVARSGTRVRAWARSSPSSRRCSSAASTAASPINDAGQVLFKATLEDGRGVLLRTGR